MQAASSTITYTITLQNNSAVTATGIVITGTIPNSTTHSSHSSGGTFGGTNVVWSGLTAAGNSSINVSFQVSVAAITDGDKLINAISASAAGGITVSIPVNTVTVGSMQSIYLPIVFRNN